MKSLMKSTRVAAEIFTPPLLFSIVLALQMARPADPGKKTEPVKAGINSIDGLHDKQQLEALTHFKNQAQQTNQIH